MKEKYLPYCINSIEVVKSLIIVIINNKMNNKRNVVIGLGTLALVLGVSGIMANTTDAYKGDPSVRGPNYTEERHTAMEKAFETNDYTTWSKLMNSKGRVTQVINKDNFAKFVQAHELAEKGDKAGAAKIRAELGLGLKDGPAQGQGNGAGKGIGRGNCMNR